jgi:uncharacterized protein
MNIAQQDNDVIFSVTVVANAQKSHIVGWENNSLKVRIHAVREKGKANDALVEFLAKIMGVPKRDIEILSGHTSKHKRLRIHSVSMDSVIHKFSHLPT